MKLLKILFLTLLFCSCTVSKQNSNDEDPKKLIEYFNTSIHSKKNQVVHLGTITDKTNNEIPHALLIKFDANRNGMFSSQFTLKDIEFNLVNFTTKDPKLIIEKIRYFKDEKKFEFDVKIDDKNSKLKNSPIDKNSDDYFLKNKDYKTFFSGNIVIKKGTVLDFHINFINELATDFDKETPEIECKLKVN
ncbi:hypothetical protein [Polaribacter sp. Asnod6-C07]|uniref:hypothetical protein n=1 Tax=Polaribacter sp. Asnod6-C07 TaxID=3160582 RepID=UPI00386E6F5F